jgi:hypothetical protein
MGIERKGDGSRKKVSLMWWDMLQNGEKGGFLLVVNSTGWVSQSGDLFLFYVSSSVVVWLMSQGTNRHIISNAKLCFCSDLKYLFTFLLQASWWSEDRVPLHIRTGETEISRSHVPRQVGYRLVSQALVVVDT